MPKVEYLSSLANQKYTRFLYHRRKGLYARATPYLQKDFNEKHKFGEILFREQ